jgi:hypothetical protein
MRGIVKFVAPARLFFQLANKTTLFESLDALRISISLPREPENAKTSAQKFH